VTVLNLLLGLVGLVAGAELAVHGALGLARHWRWPTWLCGLLLLALGTSLPEFFVSLQAVAEHPALSFGNVFGSNAFNAGVVLAMGLLLVRRRGLPVQGFREAGLLTLLGVSILTAYLFGRGSLPSPLWGLAYLAAYPLVLRGAIHRAADDTGEGFEIEPNPVLKAALMITGFVLLALASNRFLEGSLAVAAHFGWSDGIAGFLIAAIGTSAPELFTTMSALRRGRREAVLGNVLGSNLFNLLVVGGTITLLAGRGASAEMQLARHAWMNLGASLLLLVAALLGKRPRAAVVLAVLFLGAYLAALVTLGGVS